MDQTIAAATILALAFWLFQVAKGRRDARKKQQADEDRRRQLTDEASYPATIPKAVIDQLRQQSPPPQPSPPARKRKKR